MKILHLGFNLNIANELYYVSEQLDLNLIFKRFTDGVNPNNSPKLYNVSYELAKNAWENNKDFYNKFDMIITSDTCPISRVFLQNNYNKKLIIYVCNRFDYYDKSSLDCDFPDQDYYKLMANVKNCKNVKILAYTEFENLYAKKYCEVDIGSKVIKPIGKISSKFSKYDNISSIPKELIKEDLFFVSTYHNNTQLIDLSKILNELKIPNYVGEYKNVKDLIGFKGIMHIPSSWSDISLFKILQLGIIYFVPTMNFLLKLKSKGNFYWNPPFTVEYLAMSEWYCDDHKNIIIYFESWQDLRNKVKNTNYEKQRGIITQFMLKHEKICLDKWSRILLN